MSALFHSARAGSSRRHPVLLALAAAACLAAPLVAVPPTNEQVENAVKIYRSAERGEPTKDVVARALKDIDLSEATGSQLLDLTFARSGEEATAKAFKDRVVQLSAEPTADGATAATIMPQLIQRPGRGEPRDAYMASVADAIAAAANHPGLAAAAIMSFLLSFGEVTVTAFLTTARTITLPVRIYAEATFALEPTVHAVSALLILVTIGALLALNRLVRLDRLYAR